MRRPIRLLYVLGVAAATLAPAAPAAARAGHLDAPGIALPAGFPPAARAQIQEALERKDCRFLGGSWVNASTTLRYAGTTVALNQFIEALGRCPGTTVSVSLRKLDDPCDWRVGHLAYVNNFHIEVNLNSKGLDLESLVFPQAKGPEFREK